MVRKFTVKSVSNVIATVWAATAAGAIAKVRKMYPTRLKNVELFAVEE